MRRDKVEKHLSYLSASLGACLHIIACTYDMSIGVPEVLRLAKVEDHPSSVPRSLFLSRSLSFSLSLFLSVSLSLSLALCLSLHIYLPLLFSLSLPLSLSHDSTFSM